jgi:polysaccharide chain length determinant protein (PEP-CTERM system associated)
MLPGKSYTPDDLLRVARRRWWMVIIPALLAASGAAVYSLGMPDRFRSTTLIMVTPQRVPESYVRPTVTQRIEDRLASLQQQILSRTRLERIIAEFDLYAQERREMPMQDVVDRMRGDIDARPVRGDVFTLSYISSSARTAKDVTERLASMFIDENLRDRTAQAESTSQFLRAQLEETRTKLEAIEQQRAQFRQRYMGELPEQVTSNLAVLSSTQIRAQSLTDANAADMMRKANIERQIAELTAPLPDPTIPATGVGGSSADYLAGAIPTGGTTAARLEQAREMQKQLEMRLRPEHPDVRRIQRTIADLAKQLDEESLARPISPGTPGSGPDRSDPRASRVTELRQELANVVQAVKQRDAELSRLNGLLAQYQNRIQSSPALENELMQIERNYATYRQQYDDLLTKSNSAEMAAGVEQRQIGEQFRILDPARVPERPFSPNRPQLVTMWLLGGLVLGVGVIGLLEYRDSSYQTADDVVAVLALPVLAAVPVIRTSAERRRARRRRWALSVASVCVAVAGLTVLVWRFGL